jgi:hypothetical protein
MRRSGVGIVEGTVKEGNKGSEEQSEENVKRHV